MLLGTITIIMCLHPKDANGGELLYLFKVNLLTIQ